MPRYQGDWESEYHDPISDEEDRRARQLEERQNAAIMAEIELCKRMQEDEEFAEQVRRLEEEERKIEQCFFDIPDEHLDDYCWDDDLYEEDYQYWSKRSGR